MTLDGSCSVINLPSRSSNRQHLAFSVVVTVLSLCSITPSCYWATGALTFTTVVRRQQPHRLAGAQGRRWATGTPCAEVRHRTIHQMSPRNVPELVVFDLDACFWDQEMYLMNAIPQNTLRGDLNGRGEGVVAALSGREPIRLHRGSLEAFQRHADGAFPGTKFLFASSADTPFAEKCGRAALKLLEVLPGLTVWDLVVGRDWEGQDFNQIGRQPPLSSNKARSHFPRIRELTGIRYDRMLFFDDCNWGDHCGMVQSACREPDTGKGPAICRTPNGLGLKEWAEGLKAYEKQAHEIGIS